MKKIYLIQSIIKDESFNNRIKALGKWLKYFSDNWIVESTLTAKEIHERISIDHENERIFIIELNNQNYWGRMNTTVWDYLKERKKQ
jgi:hypothetical protein